MNRPLAAFTAVLTGATLATGGAVVAIVTDTIRTHHRAEQAKRAAALRATQKGAKS